MRKRWAGAAAAAVLTTISLFGATSASAFIEVGNNCTATEAAPETTLLQVSKAPESPLPLATPITGVATKWRINAPDLTEPTEPVPQRLIVFRAVGNPGEYLAVAESATEGVTDGQNVFDTRIPVQVGDRFGAYGPTGTVFCQSGNPLDIVGALLGDTTVGSTQTFSATPEYKVAVSAIVEPDADGDGYGDETQDFCPTDASVQGACPQPPPPPPPPVDLALDSFPLPAKRSILILVTPTVRATVRVSGTVRAPRTKKRRARRSAVIRLRGPRRTVTPGQIGRLRLRFTRPLLSALRVLPKRRSLTLRLVVIARDASGRTVKDTARVRLRGRKKT